MAGPKGIPQRQVYVPDVATSRVDQARADLAQTLSQCPFVCGRLVSVSFVAATAKTVRHGLGVAAACFVIRQNYDPAHSGPRMTEADQTGVDLTQGLSVTTDVNCTLDLWFYPRASRAVDAGQGQSL